MESQDNKESQAAIETFRLKRLFKRLETAKMYSFDL